MSEGSVYKRCTCKDANLLAATRPGQRLPDRDTVARRIAVGIPASTTLTVGQYLTEWIDKRGKLAETTDRGYRSHIRLYLIPHLGQMPLQSLRDTHIVAMYAAIRRRDQQILAARSSPDPAVRAGVKGARTMGAATRQRLLATLRKALNDAVRDKLIDRNPAAIIELDSGERPKPRIWTPRAVQHWQRTGQRPSPVMVWLPEHAGQFLDYTETHDIAVYAMFTLILHRGLRRGEACGLRDFDVDILPDPPDDLRLDCGTLTIAQQITTVGYRPITKKVKSRAGDRIIPLGPATVTVLRDYLRMRERWRQVSGSAWPETGLFFVRPDGQPWHPQTITDRFEYLVRKSGLPPVRLHDLRHCAATYLRHGGADLKEVQETLGHSSITLTSDTYTSVILELQNKTAAADLIPRQSRLNARKRIKQTQRAWGLAQAGACTAGPPGSRRT